MQQAADRRTVHDDPASGQLCAQFIKRQVAVLLYLLAHPISDGAQLAAANVTLPHRFQRSCFPLQDHHVVDEARRNPEMSRSLPVRVAFLYKRNDTLTQFHRMRFAHDESPAFTEVNQKSVDMGILNLKTGDTL